MIIGGTGAIGRATARRLRAVFGNAADLLVDCACYTAQDVTGLLPVARDAASTVLISSKAAYGRHSNSPVKPCFAGPVREDQPTVAPGYGDRRKTAGWRPGWPGAGRGREPS